MPPQTSPVLHASSSVSWCSLHRCRLAGQHLAGRDDGVGLDAAAAERAERPFALDAGQDQLGADDLRRAPWVRITVATANGTPAAASSCMRSKGDDMVLGAIGGAGSRGVRTPHGQSNTSSARS